MRMDVALLQRGKATVLLQLCHSGGSVEPSRGGRSATGSYAQCAGYALLDSLWRRMECHGPEAMAYPILVVFVRNT